MDSEFLQHLGDRRCNVFSLSDLNLSSCVQGMIDGEVERLVKSQFDLVCIVGLLCHVERLRSLCGSSDRKLYLFR